MMRTTWTMAARGAVLVAWTLAAGSALATDAPAEGQLVLAENESFLLPIDEPGNRLPEYPAAVLAQPQSAPSYVCMRVDIDEEGKVGFAGPIVRDPDCPPITELTKQFADAAATALATWRFEPAIKCVFRNKRAKEAAGMSCSGGREVPQATTLTFRFLFEQVDGRGVVRMQR
jgi:hypothetical protein